jgi:hypothetical protein
MKLFQKHFLSAYKIGLKHGCSVRDWACCAFFGHRAFGKSSVIGTSRSERDISAGQLAPDGTASQDSSSIS